MERERPFDEELSLLKEKLLRMASMAEESISLAVNCLKERKEELAQDVFKREDEINFRAAMAVR